MKFQSNRWYHVYNRGNNSQQIFFSNENYIFFIRKIRRQIIPHSNIISYCLMPNHFHLLLHIKDVQQADETKNHPLVQNIATVLRSYAQAINKQQNRTGSLFQHRTKAKNLSSGDRNYAITCFHYIHQNPLRAGIVQHLEDWEFSSYNDYAGLRNGTLPAKKLAFKTFSIKDEAHFDQLSKKAIDAKLLNDIF